MELYEEISRLRKSNTPCALATIVKSIGSSPRKIGTKMLVRGDGSTMGTIGGGEIEAKIIDLALSSIADGVPKTVPFDLTERKGILVCGGKIFVFVEPVLPDPQLLIVGAGHVGKALSTVARFSGFRVTVIDDRPEYANPENLPDAHTIVVNEFIDPFHGVLVDDNSYVVIATRGHTHDLDGLKAALVTDARYIGLVGSWSKKTLLFGSLRDLGFPEDIVGRVIVPVGLPIGSVTPEEIAISIMAQIISQRRDYGVEDIGDTACSGDVPAPRAGQTAPSAQ
jgi:xanthine dehydrogenase accessory factor